MEKWIKEAFPATARLLKALMNDLMCVKCTALEKDVYVLDCCNAKCCKQCATRSEGDVCAKCETKRKPRDSHKDFFSSSVAELWIKFQGDYFEGKVNVDNFLEEADVFLSKIQSLHESAEFKTVSKLKVREGPSAAAGSEFALSSLTNVIPSASESVMKALSDMESGGAASSLKTLTDEELLERSTVCIPASPEILGPTPTPQKLPKAMPSSLIEAFRKKRLVVVERGGMIPVNETGYNLIDQMEDLGIDFIEEGVYPPADTGLTVDELEKDAEIQYKGNSSTESDETMEPQESKNKKKPAAGNIVKPSRVTREAIKFKIHRHFRTRSKVGKTIFGSQSPSTSDDLSIGVRTANLLKSVLSKKEGATLSDTVTLAEESKIETFESDASVHGDITMVEYGTTKSPVPVMAADPLGDDAGYDKDLFGDGVYWDYHEPQSTTYPIADKSNNASTEQVVKKKRKAKRGTLKLKKRPTTWHGNRLPPPLRKSQRLREKSTSSTLDEMTPPRTPRAAASSSACSSASSKNAANAALEEILDLGTDEERELGEIEQYQKASKDSDVDNSASSSTPAKEKRNANGETPLHIACHNGNVEKVQELLESGAEIRATDHAGWIPLYNAISGEGTDVAKGAIVKLLCQRGCNVNALCGIEADTPLHEASFYGLARIVEILLSFGAVPTIRNADGKLPRDVSDNDFIIRLLDKRASDKRMSLNATTMANLALEDPSLQQIRSHKAVFFFNFDVSDRVRLEVMARLHLRVSDKLDNTVTHIVYETSIDNEDDLLVPFGWEYMFGLAKGLWQVSHHWIGKSLYHSRCLPLNDFEISGCGEPTDQAFKYLKYQTFAGTTGIPGLARVNKEKGNPGLLDGFTFYLYKRCGVGKLNKKNIGLLAVKAGAQITNQKPDPETIDPLEFPSRFHTFEDNNHKFVLTTHVILFTDHEAPPESKKYSMEHVKSLNLNWFVNSIGHFELVDPEDYL